jgi:hypothetical protein
VGVNRPVPQGSKSKSTYLIYCIDNILGIVPREIFSHLDVIVVRENCRDQRDALVRGEGIAD